jgi:hypothetical protein
MHRATKAAILVGHLGLLATSARAVTADLERRLPEEYESTSGNGVALNNGGYALNDGASAVRANPALLSTQKQYAVSAGYHWPAQGRDYFQASVVDSKTAPIAAGVTYTGFTDNYEYDLAKPEASPSDSPIVRRGVVGLSQLFGGMSAGLGATYVEANRFGSDPRLHEGDTSHVRGVGLNVGVAGILAPGLTGGVAVENASNQKIADYEPRQYKGGVAYAISPAVTALLDYRQRDRVAEFEGVIPQPGVVAEPVKLEPEKMAILSLAGQVADYLRLLASYGKAFGDDRRSLAGGAALVSHNFSVSYTLSRPYMAESKTHQAVSLTLDMAL